MRILFNIFWWIMVIVGFGSLSEISDDVQYFDTIEEAEAFIQSTGVANVEVQSNDDTSEDAKPYVVRIPSEKDFEDLGFIPGIALIITIIQLFKIALLVLRFIWLVIAPEKEPVEPEFVAIVFFW